MNMNIEGKEIGGENPAYIIAEAGLNHGGDLDLAKKMIITAAISGADAIKFQAFDTDQRFGDDTENLSLVRPAEFNEKQFKELMKTAHENKITFFSTAFDNDSVEMLCDIGVPLFKVASCDVKNKKLLEKVASTQIPVILSTGTANAEEIYAASNIFEKNKCSYALLHCVSSYPLNPKNANLKAIKSLKNKFDVAIGYSDHSIGIEVPVSSIYAGAQIIEKHFTLAKELRGIDWEISSSPSELTRLIEEVRRAEQILGSGSLESLACEEEELQYRNSLRDSEF